MYLKSNILSNWKRYDLHHLSSTTSTHQQTLSLTSYSTSFSKKIQNTFRRPGNTKASQAVLHFLILLIFPKDTPKLFKPCYPILDKSQERDFRKIIDGKLAELERSRLIPLGYGRKSVSSSGGGFKFMSLLWVLSNLALRQCVICHPLQVFSLELGKEVGSEGKELDDNRDDFLKVQIEARKLQFSRSVKVAESSCGDGIEFVEELKRGHEEIASEIRLLREEIGKLKDVKCEDGIDVRAKKSVSAIRAFLAETRGLRGDLESLLSNDVDRGNRFDFNVEKAKGAGDNGDIVALIRLATAKLQMAIAARPEHTDGDEPIENLEEIVHDSLRQHLEFMHILRSNKRKGSEILNRNGGGSHENYAQSSSGQTVVEGQKDMCLLSASPKRRPRLPRSLATSAANNEGKGFGTTLQLPSLLDSLHDLIVQSQEQGAGNTMNINFEKQDTGDSKAARNKSPVLSQVIAHNPDPEDSRIANDTLSTQSASSQQIANAEEKIAEAEEELADAKQEIVECEEEIVNGKQDVNGKQEIADGEQDIVDTAREHDSRTSSVTQNVTRHDSLQKGEESTLILLGERQNQEVSDEEQSEHQSQCASAIPESNSSSISENCRSPTSSSNNNDALDTTPFKTPVATTRQNQSPGTTGKGVPGFLLQLPAGLSPHFSSPPPASHRKLSANSLVGEMLFQRVKARTSNHRDSLTSLFDDTKSEGSLLFEDTGPSPQNRGTHEFENTPFAAQEDTRRATQLTNDASRGSLSPFHSKAISSSTQVSEIGIASNSQVSVREGTQDDSSRKGTSTIDRIRALKLRLEALNE